MWQRFFLASWVIRADSAAGMIQGDETSVSMCQKGGATKYLCCHLHPGVRCLDYSLPCGCKFHDYASESIIATLVQTLHPDKNSHSNVCDFLHKRRSFTIQLEDVEEDVLMVVFTSETPAEK